MKIAPLLLCCKDQSDIDDWKVAGVRLFVKGQAEGAKRKGQSGWTKVKGGYVSPGLWILLFALTASRLRLGQITHSAQTRR